MIPLAQYFAESGSEDFKPLRTAKPERKAVMHLQRPADALPKANMAQPSVRPLKAFPVRAAAQPAAAPVRQAPATGASAPAPQPRIAAEPKISLREFEAERAAWQAERDASARETQRAVEAARREGEAVGRIAGRLAAQIEIQADFDQRLEAARAEFAEAQSLALADSRSTWTIQQGDRLAELMVLQMSVLEETIKVSLNNVVRPLALDARQRQTLDELVGTVRALTLDGKAFRLSAAGPMDLLRALESRLGDEAQMMSFEPDESRSDIRIDVDNTVIETRLASWQRALEEALS